MSKTAAEVLLIVFGNLLTVLIGAALIPLIGHGFMTLIFAAVILAAHVTGSAFSCRRFKCRFEISPGKYVLCGAMPAAALDVILVMAWIVFQQPAVEQFGESASFLLGYSIFCAGYSVLYLIILTVIVSRYE